jgi:uncharacterized membrane protein
MQNMKYVFALLLVFIYLIFGPILFIWSLNTLFSMNILYTFNNWLAVYIFLVILNVAVNPHTKIVQIRDDKYKDEKADQKRTESNS